MSISVGELFVNLGIKGAEKTVGSLGEVSKGLGEIKHMSLEAKAELLAVAYEFEHLMSKSGQTGTSLVNFQALTGLSAETLQRWQYAARQAGDSAEDFEGSLKGVQNSVSNILMGKGAPESMGLISRVVSDFDPSRMRDTFYMMTKLQEAAQKLPKDVGLQALKAWGLSEGTIAAMQRNAFNPGVMNRAPIYGTREQAALDRANIAWENLGHHIEMAFGHFNAKHGQELVKGIADITEHVVHLAEALVKIAEKIKIFDAIGKAFEGWAMILNGVNSTVDAVADLDDPKKREKTANSVMSTISEVPNVVKAFAAENPKLGVALAPFFPSAAQSLLAGAAAGVTNMSQTNHFHGKHDDLQKKVHDVTKGAKDAVKGPKEHVKQSPATRRHS